MSEGSGETGDRDHDAASFEGDDVGGSSSAPVTGSRFSMTTDLVNGLSTLQSALRSSLRMEGSDPGEQRRRMQMALQLRHHAPYHDDEESESDGDEDTAVGELEGDTVLRDSTEEVADMVESDGIAAEDGSGMAGRAEGRAPRQAAPVELDEATTVELQIVTKWIEDALPYLIILVIIFLKEHRVGLLMFAWHSCVLFQSGQTLKRQMALREDRQAAVLLGSIALMISNILTTFVSFSEDQLWRQFVFLPPIPYTLAGSKHMPTFTLWDVCWTVFMNDLMIRLGCMVVKSIIVLLHNATAQRKRQAQIMACVESISHLYRSLLPISVWVAFFLNDSNTVFSCITAGFYLTIKLSQQLSIISSTVSVWRACLLQEVPYGSYATKEDVMEAGDQCTICQDRMEDALKLPCGHLFCEHCICAWLEQQRTCPLCRHVVVGAGMRRHSEGSVGVSFQIF